MLAQPLEVGDQVGRGVGRQVDGGRPRVRRAPAAVPLVQLHHEVGLGVEPPAAPRRAARAGAAVQDHGGLALAVAGQLPVQAVALADVEHALVEHVLVLVLVLGRGLRGAGHARSLATRPLPPSLDNPGTLWE